MKLFQFTNIFFFFSFYACTEPELPGLGHSRARLFPGSVVPGLGHSRDPGVPGSWNVYWGLCFILLIIKHLGKRTIHPGTPSPSFPGFGYSRARCSRVCISLPEIFYDEQNIVRASINISTTGNDRTPGMTEPGNNRAREQSSSGITEPGNNRAREHRARDSRFLPGLGACLFLSYIRDAIRSLPITKKWCLFKKKLFVVLYVNQIISLGFH
jgi:hypothetical protein